MKVKLVVERGGQRKTFRLSPPVAVIGRAHGSAVRVPSSQVSRQHCRLWIADGLVHVEDLGSVNGTFLNGQRVLGREPVRPGDQLDVGPVRFKVDYDISLAALAKLKPAPVEDVDVVDDVPVLDMLGGLADGSIVDQVEEMDDVELALDVAGPVDDEDDLPVFEDAMAIDDDVPMLPVVEEDDDFKPLPAGPDEKMSPQFTFNQPWQMPDAGDLRDILAQMEDDDRTPPPPPPPPKPPKKKR